MFLSLNFLIRSTIELSKQSEKSKNLPSARCSPRKKCTIWISFYCSSPLPNKHRCRRKCIKLNFAQLKVLGKGRREKAKKSPLTRKINLNEAKYFYLVKHATRRLKRLAEPNVESYDETCKQLDLPIWGNRLNVLVLWIRSCAALSISISSLTS